VSSYFFVLQGRNDTRDDPGSVVCWSDEAAREYAERIVFDLKQAFGYEDPDLELIVINAAGEVVDLVSF
jgi:hypothetical protein